jgi:hypothetical protein
MSGGVMEWRSVGFVSSLSVQDRWAELQEVVRSRFLGQASQRRAGGALHSAKLKLIQVHPVAFYISER